MKKIFTLSALTALALASFGAQAQITVDGTLSATEMGTAAGQYQLVGTYTGAHSVADRGLKALYMGVSATTLNVMVVCSPEQANYSHVLLYLDAPGKTGIASGTRVPGVTGNTPLTQRPTLDMPVDYAFRVTVSPLSDQPGAMYLSRADYTVATPIEIGMGTTAKNGTATTDASDPSTAQSAFKTSATGSVAANTTTGWEFSMPLSALGGAATGSVFNVMVGYVNDDTGKPFYSDLLPQVANQTTDLGLDPNFNTIPGTQHYGYKVGSGVLAARAGSAPALQATAYPNPVTAGSQLSYVVPGTAQPVSLDVYNSLGQKAMTLLSTTQTAGSHTANLAAVQKLAPGAYLVLLRVGTQLSTHRVVVE